MCVCAFFFHFWSIVFSLPYYLWVFFFSFWTFDLSFISSRPPKCNTERNQKQKEKKTHTTSIYFMLPPLLRFVTSLFSYIWFFFFLLHFGFFFRICAFFLNEVMHVCEVMWCDVVRRIFNVCIHYKIIFSTLFRFKYIYFMVFYSHCGRFKWLLCY